MPSAAPAFYTVQAFRVSGELSLESAEGCYSRAAASDASLKIKFSVKVGGAHEPLQGTFARVRHSQLFEAREDGSIGDNEET